MYTQRKIPFISHGLWALGGLALLAYACTNNQSTSLNGQPGDHFDYSDGCVTTGSTFSCPTWSCDSSMNGNDGMIRCETVQLSSNPVPDGTYTCTNTLSRAECPGLGPTDGSWQCTATSTKLVCTLSTTAAFVQQGTQTCVNNIVVGGNSGNSNNQVDITGQLNPCSMNTTIIASNSGNNNGNTTLTGPIGNLMVSGNKGNYNNHVSGSPNPPSPAPDGGATPPSPPSSGTSSPEICIVNITMGGSSGNNNNNITLPNVSPSCVGVFTGNPGHPKCVIDLMIGGSSGNNNNNINLAGLPPSCLGKITIGGSSGNNNNNVNPPPPDAGNNPPPPPPAMDASPMDSSMMMMDAGTD